MKRMYSVPAALVGAFGLVVLGSTVAQAATTDCTADLGDQTITGDLVVPAGATCVLAGATVEGGITVLADGWLDATSVTVTGDVVATDPYGVLLDGTRVDGDVSAYTSGSRVGFLYLNDLHVGGSVAAGGLDVEITGSDIAGGVTTQAATYVDLLQTGVKGDVAIDGSDWGVNVAGAVVGGGLAVTGSSRDVLIGATTDGAADTWGNTVGGDLTLTATPRTCGWPHDGPRHDPARGERPRGRVRSGQHRRHGRGRPHRRGAGRGGRGRPGPRRHGPVAAGR